MAEKKTAATEEAKTEKTAATEEAKKTILVKLPRRTGHNANQDEFFSVNFKNYIIKRGEYVEIPYEVYEVIKNSEKAEDAAFKFAEENKLREPGKE